MTDQKHDHIKWFTIGFLSALGVLAVLLMVLIYFTTPLMKIDQATGRVQFLGGLIDVQAKDVITQLSKEGSFVIGTIEGVQKIPPEAEVIAIKFGAGQIRVDYNSTDEMNWDCDGAGKSAKISTAEKLVSLDFSSAFVDCDISVPVKRVRIEGLNGEIEVRKIQADLEVKLISGDVYLDPIPAQKYEFDLKATSGEVDEALRSEDSVNKSDEKKAFAIKVKVETRTGNIEQLD